MGSKIVQQRQRKANAVEAAALANRERLNRALAAKLESLGVTDDPVDPEVVVDATPDGEELPAMRRLADPDRPRIPDVDNLQRFAAWMVGLARDRMRLADRQTESERHDDLDPRNERDESAAQAYRTLVDVRRVVQGALGEAGVVRYLGIQGPLAQNTLGIANQVEDTIERLTDPELPLPEVEAEWMSVDWDRLVASLREVFEPLRGAIREIDRQQRDADLAVIEKEEALRSFQDDYVGWSDVLRGLYTVAAQRELASRLTPTVPTRSGGGLDDGPANDDVPQEDVPAAEPAPSGEDGAQPAPAPEPPPAVPDVVNEPEPAEEAGEVQGGDVA